MAIEKLNLSFISILVVIFPLSIFILSAINIKVTLNLSFLDEIKSSLNDYPINDLSFDVDCNEKNEASLYTFPGSQVGCSCIDVDNYIFEQKGTHRVNPGICNLNQTLNKCKTIFDIDGKNLSLWGNGKFCYKKYETKESQLKGYLLMLNNSVLENEECEKGYKKCGKLDDMGNYLCIKEDDDCPINDIKVTVSQQPDLEKLNYSYILINNKFFYYSNTSEKPVITKLKVTEDGKLCTDKSYIYTKYPQYILDNNFKNYGCRKKINGQLYEKDVEVLDTRTKKQLYNDSDINLYSKYNFTYYQFPFYSLEANMTLYPKRYLGYDKKCLLENEIFDIENTLFKDEKINEKIQLTNDVLSINNFIKWFSIVSIIIEFIASSCNIGNEEYKLAIYIWTIVNSLIYITIAVPIYINVSNIKKISVFFTCGSDVLNGKINFYNSSINTLKITTIISCILINCQILFNIAMIILKYIIKKRLKDLKYQPLVTKNNSSLNIDYTKCPESAYYDKPGCDQNDNNATPAPPSLDNYTPKIDNQKEYTNS